MKYISKRQLKITLTVIITIVLITAGALLWWFKNAPIAEASWWNDNWSYRKAIVINHQYVEADLTNFPVLISFTDSNLSNHAQEDGDDFIFVNTEGKKLSHEIEKYASSTGELVAWVKIPELSSTDDTVLYLYYGNSAIGNQQDAENVWDENYMGVWHLPDDETASTTDSTKYNNDGTAVATASTTATGQIDGAFQFDGNSDYVLFDPTNQLDSAIGTVSMWFRAGNTAGDHALLFLYETGYDDYFRIWQTGDEIQLIIEDAGGVVTDIWTGPSGCITTGNWYHIVCLQDGTQARLFINGIEVSFGGTNSTYWTGHLSPITGWLGRNSWQYGNVQIDEVRISNIRRSTSSIETSYNNQNSPATFLSVQAEEVGPGPVGYWTFDKGHGTTAYDESGQGNDGIISDATWQDESMCVSGKCLWFDGSDDIVEIDNEQSLNPDSITVAAWIKSTGAQPSNSGSIATKQNTGFSDGYSLRLRPDNIIEFVVKADSLTYTTSHTKVATNTWYFVAGKYDSNAGEQKLYINGVEEDSTNNSYDIEHTTFGLGIGSANVAGVTISDSEFHGFIDEVKIYPYARTADEIRQDYNAGKAGIPSSHGVSVSFGSESESWMSDGLVGYWKMDESATTSGATDSSGNGNNGAYEKTASTTAGKFGNGGVFDGDDDYIYMGAAAELQTGLTSFTASAWVKTTTVSGIQEIVRKIESTGQGQFYLRLNNDKVDFAIRTSSFDALVTTDTVSADTWHHVVGVWDGTNKMIYIDGEFSINDSHTGTMDTDTNPLTIGCYYRISESACWLNEEFNGTIDEVRIYNRALSPREVRKLYEWAPGPVAHWKFDEMTGTTAYDSAASTTFSGGNHGTLGCSNGGCDLPNWTRGKYGGALDFDGVFGSEYDYVDVTGLSSITQPYSISLWFYPKESGRTQTLVSLDQNDGLPWLSFNSSDKVVVQASSEKYVYGSTVLNLHTWNHVVFIVNTANIANWVVYLNGVDDTGTPGGDTGTYEAPDSSAFIGLRDTSYNTPFNGQIDDVRIYNYALNQKQIINVMNGRQVWESAVGSPVGSAVLHLKLDKGTGATAYDSSPQGNNGTLIASTSGSNTSASEMWSLDGKFGRAMEFDGNDDYTSVVNDSSLDFGNEITVSTWVKWNSIGGWESIVHGSNSTNRGNAYWLGASGGTTIRWSIDNDQSNDLSFVYTTDTWYHLAGTYDGTNAVIYINGEQEKSWDRSAAGSIDNEDGVRIGEAGDGSYNLSGLIDDVRIYNFALNEDEIKLIYNQGKSAVMGAVSTATTTAGTHIPSWSASREYCVPGSDDYCAPPVAEWRFDEKQGTTTYDKSGQGNDGVFVSNATSPIWRDADKCKIGSCLEFDGSSDSVECFNQDIADYSKNFTIEAWINPDDLDSGNELIFQTGGSVQLGRNGQDLTYYTNGDNTTASGVLIANRWTFANVLYNGTSIKIYVDGIEEASEDKTAQDAIANACIGSYDGSSDYFDGLIDHVRIYDYERTPAQIAWDYNRGKPIAHWKFDECKGGTIYDQSQCCKDGVGCNHGTLQIGTGGTNTATGTCASSSASSFWWNGRNGHINSGGSFDGDSDYVDCGNDTSLVLHDKDFTIAAWAKLSSKGSDREIIGKLPLDGLKGIELRYDVGDDYWELSAHDGAWQHAKYSQENPNLNEWYHVVGQYLMDEEVIRIYVNGVLGAITDTINLGITDVSANKLMIGCQGEDTDDRLFDGLIDEVKIFNYALTAEQVKIEYTGGAVRFGQ